MGDFNADLRQSSQQNFGKVFIDYCREEGVVFSDYLVLYAHKVVTSYSDSCNTCSWLNHIITPKSGYDIVKTVRLGSWDETKKGQNRNRFETELFCKYLKMGTGSVFPRFLGTVENSISNPI